MYLFQFDPRASQKAELDSKLKSAVVRRSRHRSDDSDDPDTGDLDFDSELKLVKKQQYLQKQLSLLEQEEEENNLPKQTITIERQVITAFEYTVVSRY